MGKFPMTNVTVANATRLHNLSDHEVLSVCRSDARKVSDDTDRFVAGNLFQYRVAIETWLNLAVDVSGDVALSRILADAILTRGLLNTIELCDNLAVELINELHTGSSNELDPEAAEIGYYIAMIDSTADQLMVLRFLKRFTVTNSRLLERESYDKILKLNTRPEVMESWYLDYQIHNEVLYILNCDDSAPSIDATEYYRFSSGSTVEGKQLAKKLRGLNRFSPFYRYPGYPLSNYKSNQDWPIFADPYFDYDPFYCIELKSVPKSFKAYRIIAPERSYEAFHMQGLRHILEILLENGPCSQYFDPSDQDQNRSLARESSLDGLYATLDLSSASDSIQWSCAKRWLPLWVIKYVAKYRATHLKVKYDYGETVIMSNQILLTSGNPCTFDLEGIIFLAIYRVATRIWSFYTGQQALPPYIFGDDGLCDSRVYETLLDVLSRLGFTVNETKSFCRGSYRESCGVEYWFGLPVHHSYWPRKVVSNNDLGVVELCSLQHRTYPYFLTQDYLVRTVRELYPDMTSSRPGSDCTDLWSRWPRFGKRCAPMKKHVISKDEIPPEWTLREAHYVLFDDFGKEPSPGSPDDINIQTYLYVEFLMKGPQYDSPLDELLRVSSKRKIDSSLQKPSQRLRKITI